MTTPAEPPEASPAAPPDAGTPARDGVTIVVPVYGALDEVERCVAAVLRATCVCDHRLLLVNDGSPQPDAEDRLLALARRDDRVSVRSRPDNRGYTATVNEGCRAADGDVVLLNSDTEVPDGWLDRLREVAYARPDVATVTPVSNAAGAFSVPGPGNGDLPDGTTTATMDAAVRRVSQRRRPAAPTGNGFCMYVRREAIEAVGLFDELAFPRGYGEENDFCMRAAAVGMANLIDDATFVYHQRSASFGSSRSAILRTSREVLDEIHPTYTGDVRRWLGRDDLGELRADLAATLGDAATGRPLPEAPVVLFVLHHGGGGTPQTNADLMGSLDGRFRPRLLRCGLSQWVLTGPHGEALRTWDFDEPWDARGGVEPQREAALTEAVGLVGASVVHVRSLIAVGPEYLPVLRRAGVPLVLSFHDFATVCPTIQLLDEQHRYCGGTCTPGPGRCGLALGWFGRSWTDLKHGYVHEWRRRMAEGFVAVDAFVTTSAAARDVVVEHFPDVEDRLRLIDHGRDTGRYRRIAVSPEPGERQRVASFGALGESKGIRLIEQVMKLDQQRGRRFEFHFVGQLNGRWHPEEWGGIVHGPYERSGLDAVLAGIAPSYALVASIWPETYCHTLTEAWACGLPVFASDIGTLRERVAATGAGWLLDQTDPESWYVAMCAVADDAAQWRDRAAAVRAVPPRTVDDMAADYAGLYGEVLASHATPGVAGGVVPG